MVGGCVEVWSQSVHSVLESVRIKMNEIVVLKPNKVKRMFWFSSHDTNTTVQSEEVLDAAVVDGVEHFTAESDRD